MRRQTRTTVIVVGGALAIASVGYGLGTQADDGTAIADSSQERTATPRLAFERGAPPGFDQLADRLGVDADQLARALRDFHDQNDVDRRDEFARKLADALGISRDKLQKEFERLHQQREQGFAATLAKALGADVDEVRAALDKLRGDGPMRPGEFAQRLADELGLDVSEVRAALIEIRPPLPDRRRGHDMPLKQLATALGVSRAELRAAFRELRTSAENEWQQHQKELAQFLADRFDLDVSKVEDALAATAPPLSSPHRPGLPDHPPAI
jgi:transcriptional regulator with XRE-family HTH domain